MIVLALLSSTSDLSKGIKDNIEEILLWHSQIYLILKLYNAALIQIYFKPKS